MTGNIRIEFDTDTGKLMLHAPLDNQEQKDITAKVLAAAIPIAINYVKPAIILKPNGVDKLTTPPPPPPLKLH